MKHLLVSNFNEFVKRLNLDTLCNLPLPNYH